MGERPTQLTFREPDHPGQPERISATGQVDELGIDTVDEVTIAKRRANEKMY